MKNKNYTLYDVAKRSGVSYQTVSRVINHADNVSEKTRVKVQAAMQALNYVPSRVAQQLAGKRTQTLGLVTTTLSLHAPSQIAASVKTTAGKQGFNVLISMLDVPDSMNCAQAISYLLSQRVDGLIINLSVEHHEIPAIIALCGAVPVTFADIDPRQDVNSVLFDAVQGARLGIEHLLALGSERVALLAGPETSVASRLRLNGWLQGLAEQRISALRVMHGEWSAKSGYEHISAMLAQGIVPQALAVANDQMALGALRAIDEVGLRVPHDIAIIGYDDTDDSAFFSPPLTTIKQDFWLLGQTLVEQLINQLRHGKKASHTLILPVELVVRSTTTLP